MCRGSSRTCGGADVQGALADDALSSIPCACRERILAGKYSEFVSCQRSGLFGPWPLDLCTDAMRGTWLIDCEHYLQLFAAIAAVQPQAISIGGIDGLRCELVHWEHSNTWSMVCRACVTRVSYCANGRSSRRKGPSWFVDNDFFPGEQPAVVDQLV